MKKLELYTEDYRVIDNVFLDQMHDTINQAISGSSIGVTLNGDVSASAKQFLNMIIVTFSEAIDNNTITIKTPEGFKLWKAEVCCSSDASGGTVTIRNDTDIITDAIACNTAGQVDTNETLDQGFNQFSADDDDLVVKLDSSLGALAGTIILWIENTD